MQRLKLTVERPDRSKPRTILVGHFPFTIGRALDNDLSLPAPSMSGTHLRLEKESPERFVITDLGSTNGTRLEGRRLSPHRPCRLTLPADLRLGNVRLEVASPQGDDTGFTTAASFTRLREMADETMIRETSDDCQPFFEILSGPGSGQRFHLVPEQTVAIGGGDDAEIPLQIADSTDVIATVGWTQTHCWIEAQSATLHYDNAPLETRHRLQSGDRFVVGVIELLFYDPLADTIARFDSALDGASDADDSDEPALDIDDDADETPADTDDGASTSENTSPLPSKTHHENNESPEQLGAIEWMLLTMSIVFLVGTIALLVLLFTW